MQRGYFIRVRHASCFVRGACHATIDRVSIEVADPRIYSVPTGPAQQSLIALAEGSLASSTLSRAEEMDTLLVRALAAHLQADDAPWLPDIFSAAPSAAVARHLWRMMIDAWYAASTPEGDQLAAMLFALPVIIVAGTATDDGDAYVLRGHGLVLSCISSPMRVDADAGGAYCLNSTSVAPCPPWFCGGSVMVVTWG